jgi:hypothetical protein
MASFKASLDNPNPSEAILTKVALRSTSLNAKSIAAVLLDAPVASMTLSNKASSIFKVIFMPAKVWHLTHTGKNFFQGLRFPIYNRIFVISPVIFAGAVEQQIRGAL